MVERNRLLGILKVALAGALVLLSDTSAGELQGGDQGPPTVGRTTAFPPRTPDGRPDLQGNWVGGQAQNIFLDGHLGDRPRPNAVASIVIDPPDGKIPYRSWALAKREEHWYEFIDPFAACISGVPRHIYGPRGLHVLQRPERVLIVSEWGHVTRSIRLDGTPHPPASVRLFMGDSRGRWEGDTLVVDVTNFNGKTWLAVAGDFHSDALHVVERFTLIDTNVMQYQVTLTDPVVYTRPWTMAFPMARMPAGDETWEEECHGGNVDFPTMRALYKGFFGLPPAR